MWEHSPVITNELSLSSVLTHKKNNVVKVLYMMVHVVDNKGNNCMLQVEPNLCVAG